MKLAVVSAWYNEELLAPLFLLHYHFVDEIHIILDTATDDATEEILKKDSRVVIHRYTYPEDGLDWLLKQEQVNKVYSEIDADWVLVVDADEFLYKRGYGNLKQYLATHSCDIMWAKMYQVYRHVTDKDIDYTKPPLLQRRHGSPLEPLGIQYLPDRAYFKPIVVRAKLDPQWDCGCHNYFNKTLKECNEIVDGAHWHMADPEIAIRRRIQTRNRQGKRNLALGLGIQNHFITEEDIIRECMLHMYDPVVIYE